VSKETFGRPVSKQPEEKEGGIFSRLTGGGGQGWPWKNGVPIDWPLQRCVGKGGLTHLLHALSDQQERERKKGGC